MAETAKLAVFHGAGRPFEIKYPSPSPSRARSISCGARSQYRGARGLAQFPLEQINEAFAQQDKGHVTRAAIVPN
jgi:hypothetical protein